MLITLKLCECNVWLVKILAAKFYNNKEHGIYITFQY